jgi:D-alanine transaminase
MLLWKDQLMSADEVHISYQDRGYYFGDGVYEVFRIYQGRCFEKAAHLDRLQRSAEAVQLKLPYPIERIEALLDQLLTAERLHEGTLYLQITRGNAIRSHIMPEAAEPNLLAYCNEVNRPVLTMDEGIRAVTLPDIRWLRCDIKCLNLLPNTLAKQQAVEQGVGEAILHRDGIVTECSASNIMIIRDGTLITHPANNYILHGVTRSFVLNLAEQLNIPIVEEPFTVKQLIEADEAMITGTTVEITPINEVDGKNIGDGKPGPLTRKLQEAFEQAIFK